MKQLLKFGIHLADSIIIMGDALERIALELNRYNDLNEKSLSAGFNTEGYNGSPEDMIPVRKTINLLREFSEN